jgi:5-methylcytosine-specific restriction endonuclease McrA
MTLLSSPVFWIAATVLLLAVIYAVGLARKGQRGPTRTIDHDQILEQTRRVAEEAARNAARGAQDAAVAAYQEQQRELREEQAAKRREAGLRAQVTKRQKIASLSEWRPPFVQFVKRLAEPFFLGYSVDLEQLDEWAEQRADVYIARKPYALEIVQWIHADAQRAADELSSKRSKSSSQIARERSRPVARTLVRNTDCPYCAEPLNDKSDHLDHIRPVNRGGPSEAWNMVFVCIPCNRAKIDKSLSEFMETDYARRKGMSAREVKARLESLGKHVDMLH